MRDEYDFITANIISSVLELLASLIAKHVKPGGIVVLSGILDGQDEEVLMAMTQAGFNLMERYLDGKGTSLVVTH